MILLFARNIRLLRRHPGNVFLSKWTALTTPASIPSPTRRRKSSSSAPVSADSDRKGNRHHHGHFTIQQVFSDTEKEAQDEADNAPVSESLAALHPYVPFRRLISARRAEAKRSLLVQVKSKLSAEKVFLYCSKHFGAILGMHYHRNEKSTQFSDFYVVEFKERASVGAALEHCRHGRDASCSVPVHSPFVWLSNSGAALGSEGGGGGGEEDPRGIPIYLPVFHETRPDESEILTQAYATKNMQQQILDMYEMTRMTDVSTRLRFLACEQIELAISGMFPKAEVIPFGSSVNSYGKPSSDLDFHVTLDASASAGGNSSVADSSPESSLIFHAKGGTNGCLRTSGQRTCDQLSNIITAFLPGCKNVVNILHARVPIVKYEQHLLGLECDLSMTSQSGYYMSELLYMYGELDARVRPLVYVVRKWAKTNQLLPNARPTQYYSNFILTMMVIFFLQNQYKMLPPFKRLYKLARKDEHITCEDGVECTFIRDISGLQPQLNACHDKPEITLDELLSNFFLFYSEFDFRSRSLCVITGQAQPKRTAKPGRSKVCYDMDIFNPLEPELNVSSNVHAVAVDKFQKECLYSHKVMEKMSQGVLENSLAMLFSKPLMNVSVEDLGWREEANKHEQADTVREERPKLKQVPKLGWSEKQQLSRQKFHPRSAESNQKAWQDQYEERQRQLGKHLLNSQSYKQRKDRLRVPKVTKFFNPKF